MVTVSDLDYRQAMLDVVVLQAQDDLGGLWRSLLSDPVERTAAGMREAAPAVVESYGAVAGENAAIWYEDVRPTSARSFRPQAFVPPSLAEAQGLTTWAVTPLFTGDEAAAWSRLASLLQKTVTDFDRVTVEENTIRDPAASGWRRQARADACAFCAYMAVVLDQPDYYTAAKSYHDDCNCIPVPNLGGYPEQPNHDLWSGVFDEAYNAIDREQEPLRRAYRRAGGRSTNFFREHPDLSLTTKNILARARRIAPDAFKDGVRLAA